MTDTTDGERVTRGRGELRIYFGVAPGVGKTYAMLNEGWRRAQRGADVVIGYYEDHGRVSTNEQLRDLPLVDRRVVDYRGTRLTEMDVDAVLRLHPDVALVDELAHTNAPGLRNAKRWQDVTELLDAGIDVITTLNVQHIASLNDVVERVTDVRQRETVPDAFLRTADQIELVDMSPEALRRRMAHGNIYPAEKVDAALGSYFREVNLNALRELALLWVADQVDEKLQDYRDRHGVAEVWDTREKIVVALSTAPGEQQVIRRAARSAMRNKADLVGIHVRTDDGLRTRDGEHLAAYVALLEEFGGMYREVAGNHVAAALVNAARIENATQIYIGETDRSRWHEMFHGSIVGSVVRHSGCGLDVHVISTNDDGVRHRRRVIAPKWLNLAPISFRRRVAAWLGVLVGLPLLASACVLARDSLGLQSAVPVFLIFAVAIAAVGGVWPAMIGAVVSFLVLDYFFTEPYHNFAIANVDDATTLSAFLVVAAVVGALVDITSRRARDARIAESEARGLARMATSMLTHADPLRGVLDDLVVTFRLDGAALIVPSAGGWKVDAEAGVSPPRSPVSSDGVVVIELPGEAQLVVKGEHLDSDDTATIQAFGNQIAVAGEARRLQAEAAEATARAKSNELRAALLSAVSHDLRTPLSTIKAGVSSLLNERAEWGDRERSTVLRTIDAESDRLTVMVANLLDMSRIRAGALVPKVTTVSVDEMITEMLESTRPEPGRIELHLADDVSDIVVDGDLFGRALSNVVENALKYSPHAPVYVSAANLSDRVVFRVVDRGPGIPEPDRERVFQPFQRLDDAPDGRGVGLGLAIAKGFVDAMNGSIEIDDTPGGGATFVVTVPTVAATTGDGL